MKSLLLLLLFAVVCFAQVPRVQNFGEVEAGVLYRSAQPTGNDLYELHQFGIKTVISLRDDRSVAREKVVAESLGMTFINIPLNGLKAPKPGQTAAVQEAIENAEKPIIIHCAHGEDRTGAEIAVRRMTHEHWSNQKAMLEAKFYKINWLQFSIKRYIEHFKP